MAELAVTAVKTAPFRTVKATVHQADRLISMGCSDAEPSVFRRGDSAVEVKK